ncbi:ribonuclease Z, partial [Tremellales sp. Uapishka_1]
MVSSTAEKPLPPVSVHFLGTCSGEVTDQVSFDGESLPTADTTVDFGHDIWLFDAADATLQRLHQSSLKMSNITRIFITHMHADHVLGVVSILTTIMSGVGMTPAMAEALAKEGTSKKASINIYGPKGLRKLIRTTLELTTVTLAGAYAVHELLSTDEQCSVECGGPDLHTNEAVGRDLRTNDDGIWNEVLPEGSGRGGRGWGVRAGPIKHRVPSLGYILFEPIPRLPLDTTSLIPLLQANADALRTADPPIPHPLSILSHLTSLPQPPPFRLPSGETLYPPAPSGMSPRKIVIFGDCSGGTPNSAFETLCHEPSLLVHECTNASIPESIQRGDKGRKVRKGDLEHSLVRKREAEGGIVCPEAPMDHEGEKEGMKRREEEKKTQVIQKAQSRGHSTPNEVGVFAKRLQAKRVVVNHFSAMFPSPRYPSSSPFPSLISPTSPYPYPTPWPISHSTDPPISPFPLTSHELHLRIILHSLGDQISDIWNMNIGKDQDAKRMAVPARDFMVYPIPSHELSDREVEEMTGAYREAQTAVAEWRERGGMIVDGAWVGVGQD